MHDVSSTLSAIDALSAPSSSVTQSTNPQDNGVWLIVIVFGYIFGLFLIFVIIWFIWYGTSIKRRHSHYSQQEQSETFRGPSSSGHQFGSHYDYSTQSSLSRPLAQGVGFGLSHINDANSSYSPMGVRTNPAFSSRDEYNQNLQHSLASASLNANLINSSSNLHQSQSNNHFGVGAGVGDELSSHSTSFVHSYQHRI